MKYVIIIVGFILAGCASKNTIADKTTVINNIGDFLKVNESVCSKYKSTDKVLYGCGSATSSDFNLSVSKALLDAKVFVADTLSNSIVKNETSSINEDSKGITRKYDSHEKTQIFETSLTKYKVVYQKTFTQSGRYRSYVVIEYQLNT